MNPPSVMLSSRPTESSAMDQDKSSSGSSLPVEQRKQRRRRRCRRHRRRERQNERMAGRGWPTRANLKPYVRSVESSPGRKKNFLYTDF